ncbi:SidA/IucD/PvdA family monooxygenase [Salinithrix halophila]|uniref:L-lysine N6-monooxygenase MbtG n=1 Tax=Salinithrix halophila TaxID=1485204 RepID=A0ABV8JBF2_9BACL
MQTEIFEQFPLDSGRWNRGGSYYQIVLNFDTEGINMTERMNDWDLIGIGFGPAGIALATAMSDDDEKQGEEQVRRLFIEKSESSAWQPDMLLPRTDIQHHFLRDFATPRDPRSRFTFSNYLVEKDRLFSFGHLGGVPGRIEWSDYVQWCAKQLADRTWYRHQVTGVRPLWSGGTIDRLQVTVQNLHTSETKELMTRHLAVNVGRIPFVPKIYRPYLGSQIFHSHQFLSRLKVLEVGDSPTFAVVGSGQNAIEVILSLIERFPQAEIYSINRNLGFRLVDMGHFSNEVFFPAFTDYFYQLPAASRKELFEKMKATNYSVVDFDVSQALYWKVYEDRVQGKERIHVTRCTQVADLDEREGRYSLTLEDLYTKSTHNITADAVILCTGFQEEKVPRVLKSMEPYLIKDEEGGLEITRDYQIQTRDLVRSRLFINGLTERTHGISDSTSFSMMALKAQRIYDKLKEERLSSIMQEVTP